MQPLATSPGGLLGVRAAPASLHALHLGARRQRRARALQVGCSLRDPWRVLGLEQGAGDKEVKRAHRQLVRQHHPDIKRDDPMAHARFIAIQEAYEIITGRRNGKELDSGPAGAKGWDFHDWYWKFSTKRRRQRGGAAAAEAGAPPPPEAARQQIRSQLAGLKQRAAAKAAKKRQQAPRAAASTAAAQDAWAPPAAAQRQPSPSGGACSKPRPAAVQSQAAPEAEAGLGGSREPAAAPPPPEAGAGQPTGSDGDRAMRRRHWLAEALRQGVRGAEGVPLGPHAARLASHIVALGQQLRGRLAPDGGWPAPPAAAPAAPGALEGLWREAVGRRAALHHWAVPLGRVGGAAAQSRAAAAPLQQDEGAGSSLDELRIEFEGAVRRMRSGESVAAAQACGGAAAQEQQGQPRYDAHARKFADSSFVKERLGTQLAGLRRRAAMKREDDR